MYRKRKLLAFRVLWDRHKKENESIAQINSFFVKKTSSCPCDGKTPQILGVS